MQFPFYRQHDASDCGPACLRMVARYHGKSVPLQILRARCGVTRQGVSLLGISAAAESIGFRTLAARLPYDALTHGAPLPCIAHWKQNHFVVVRKVTKRHVHVADPAHGMITYSRAEFLRAWVGTAEDEGIVLLLEPTPAFREEDTAEVPRRRNGLVFMLSYLWTYRSLLTQLVLGMLLGSVLALIFPFLTQALVDIGITNQDIGFVYTVLLAQLMLFFSQTSVDFIRRWIVLHVGARVNISIISDFLIKLVKLPMRFFDGRTVGDLLQRISDHRRIEQFLTSSTLSAAFSVVNLVVFAIVIGVYSLHILAVFLGGTLIALLWVMLFLRRRRQLDFKRFDRLSENQSKLVQLIQGMAELKLTNSETQRRWEWEHVQAALFKLNVKSLSLSQYQQAGMLFALKAKDIVVTFMAAKEVIDGTMTLGMMLAVTYMIGQLSGPIDQLIEFVHRLQDAKLSSERLSEIHCAENEEPVDAGVPVTEITDNTIRLENIWFRYAGAEGEHVLQDVNMAIPAGKVTAIVGASGSGKTTLLKLLLKFYPPSEGEIYIGDQRLRHIQSSQWRRMCGVVMQDGYIFSDTVARNVGLGDDDVQPEKLVKAVNVANAREFIEAMPLAYNMKIGAEGTGLSQGQRQRILIARAVYRDPAYLFFDEATSALDAFNERIIIDNLQEYLAGRTAVIIAHRLSTVKRADQIVVLDRGKVVECGTHTELTNARGVYYTLVKNQLELGA
jgi:ATP-binding cassette subfamily B protein